MIHTIRRQWEFKAVNLATSHTLKLMKCSQAKHRRWFQFLLLPGNHPKVFLTWRKTTIHVFAHMLHQQRLNLYIISVWNIKFKGE